MRYVLATILSNYNNTVDVVNEAYYVYNPLTYRNIIVRTTDYQLRFWRINNGLPVSYEEHTLLCRNIFNKNNGGMSRHAEDGSVSVWAYDLDKRPEDQLFFHRDKMEWHHQLAMEEFLSVHNGVR